MPLKEIRNAIAAFINKWPEVYSVGIAVAVWYWSIKVIHWIQPTAKTWNMDEIQRIIFAIAAIACVSGAVFVGIKINFPDWDKYYDNQLANDIKSVTPWQRLLLFTVIYLFLLYLLVQLVLTF